MLIWKTAGDEDVCEVCKAMKGRVDGDGWNSSLGAEVGLWRKQGDSYYRVETGGVLGGPPLHPHCRCSIITLEGVSALNHDEALAFRTAMSARAFVCFLQEVCGVRIDLPLVPFTPVFFDKS